MRRFSVLFFPALSLALCSGAACAQEAAANEQAALVPPPAIESIVSRDLLVHANLLASDALGGRLTGSPGQEAAAKYIAGHFAWLGLEPLGDFVAGDDGPRGWFQRYGITATSVTTGSFLEIAQMRWSDGFSVLGAEPMDFASHGTLRFVGLGRTRGNSAEVLEDESLEGVIPVVVMKPLRGKFDRQLSIEEKFGVSMQSFGWLRRTAQNLEKKGASAVLFVMTGDPLGLSDVLNYMAVAPGKDMLSPRFAGGDNTMGAMASMLGGSASLPTLVLSVARSQQVLAELGVEDAALATYLAGDGDLPQAAKEKPVTLHLGIERDHEAMASNVVAVLRGSDPALRDEAIVYSAHMDHVGRRMDGDVYNGADDNASGSAGMLAIASAFAAGKERPRRSIIFLSVSGEELGLWGSKFYAENPTWELGKIVGNINTDMIGRSGPESGPQEVTVTPSNRHAMFSTLVQRAARFGEELGMSFTSGDKYYMRSDHYNFAEKGIPVVFFCNGEHEDYHQVSDHADKLDGGKMERIARLAFWTGWAVANDNDRPRTLGRREVWR